MDETEQPNIPLRERLTERDRKTFDEYIRILSTSGREYLPGSTNMDDWCNKFGELIEEEEVQEAAKQGIKFLLRQGQPDDAFRLADEYKLVSYLEDPQVLTQLKDSVIGAITEGRLVTTIESTQQGLDAPIKHSAIKALGQDPDITAIAQPLLCEFLETRLRTALEQPLVGDPAHKPLDIALNAGSSHEHAHIESLSSIIEKTVQYLTNNLNLIRRIAASYGGEWILEEPGAATISIDTNGIIRIRCIFADTIAELDVTNPNKEAIMLLSNALLFAAPANRGFPYPIKQWKERLNAESSRLKSLPTELEAASKPGGRNTDLIAASAPEGRETDLIAAENPETPPESGDELAIEQPPTESEDTPSRLERIRRWILKQ